MNDHASPESDVERLKDLLRERDARFDSPLGDVYAGAVAALDDHRRPDHLAHAAHGMRELLDLLPRYYDGASASIPLPNVVNAVRSIQARLTITKERSSCFAADGPTWRGEIDSHLKTLLDHVEEAIRNASGPSRVDIFQAFQRSLDPRGDLSVSPRSERPLPELNKYRGYFNKVAHHEVTDTVENVRSKVEDCTGWLLRVLRPATAETRSILDQIIREAE